MAINLSDFDKIWASTSPLTPYSFGEANYKQGWNFIGSTPPARQMWDFLQKQNDEKMQYLANNYLPLNGSANMTRTIVTEDNVGMRKSDNNGRLNFYSGTAYQNGSFLILTSSGDVAPGTFSLNASNGTNSAALDGKYDGTLKWNGNDVLTSSNYNSYALPLSGGTMTGAIIVADIGPVIKKSNTDNFTSLWGGTSSTNGASLTLSGKDRQFNANSFVLTAADGTNSKHLQGYANGTLTWDGQPLQTSSDKRLKQDFSDVPADVLEAWSKVEWKQFKYKADVERKGDSCRFHTGLVAQDVKEVGEENNVDLLKYGILCHDVREATENSEAVDLWTVRYEEALALEVIYLRNEIKKLHEEIKALKTE